MSHSPPDLDLLCRELEETWHSEIPISRSMGIRVAEITDEELHVTAGFDANRNLHGTAFAGSLYSVCVLTGWGAAWLALRRSGIGAQIVAQDARIRYLRPVRGDIHCICKLPTESGTPQLTRLGENADNKVRLRCEIRVDQKPAVEFSCIYVLQR